MSTMLRGSDPGGPRYAHAVVIDESVCSVVAFGNSSKGFYELTSRNE